MEAVYTDASGEVLSAVRRAELECGLGEGGDDAKVQASIGGDIFSALTDTSIDVRIPLELTVTRLRRRTFQRVESVEMDEDSPLDTSSLPAVVLSRYGGRSLWELAKAHLSTMELIREANGLDAGAEPEPGAVLLIPRC